MSKLRQNVYSNQACREFATGNTHIPIPQKYLLIWDNKCTCLHDRGGEGCGERAGRQEAPNSEESSRRHLAPFQSKTEDTE